MESAYNSPIQAALEVVGTLTTEEQMALIEIIRRRFGKQQMDESAKDSNASQKVVQEGKTAYGGFEVQRLGFTELSDRLREYEQRYGYSTIEFFRRFQAGELGDDDDLMMWSGLYHLYLTSLPIRQLMQQEPAAL